MTSPDHGAWVSRLFFSLEDVSLARRLQSRQSGMDRDRSPIANRKQRRAAAKLGGAPSRDAGLAPLFAEALRQISSETYVEVPRQGLTG